MASRPQSSGWVGVSRGISWLTALTAWGLLFISLVHCWRDWRISQCADEKKIDGCKTIFPLSQLANWTRITITIKLRLWLLSKAYLTTQWNLEIKTRGKHWPWPCMQAGVFKLRADEELDSELLIMHSWGEPAVRARFRPAAWNDGPDRPALHLPPVKLQQLPWDHSSVRRSHRELAGRAGDRTLKARLC